MTKRYLAFDLGAESGRAILGHLEGGRLSLEEVHRFPNTPVRLPTGLYWDALRLFHEMEQGLMLVSQRTQGALDGIAVDTWGVDFALLGVDGALVDNPRHYRDPRNDGIMEKTFVTVTREEIFSHTGIQFMQFNTLFQLYAMKLASAPALESARRLLFIPDLLSYWLTGVERAELTIASTSQFYNPVAKRWATELFDALGLPRTILPEIIPPGDRLGALLPHLQQAAHLGPVPVFATAAHDTASAVAAVPAAGGSWCFISSGTWSLMGVESPTPVINERSLAYNFTNEVGVGGAIRLLKNITGMWPLQECRRAWSASGLDLPYQELARLAAESEPFFAAIDPDAFLAPGDMPSRIAQFCRDTGQRVPQAPGQFCRVILESLALRYRQVLESLESLTGRRIETIHIVGGGSRNSLLNQFVADSTERRVVAGPAEATAAGNILVQALGDATIGNLDAARALVSASFPLEIVEPSTSSEWGRAYENFRNLHPSP